jgi:hypothetical protein
MDFYDACCKCLILLGINQRLFATSFIPWNFSASHCYRKSYSRHSDSKRVTSKPFIRLGLANNLLGKAKGTAFGDPFYSYPYFYFSELRRKTCQKKVRIANALLGAAAGGHFRVTRYPGVACQGSGNREQGTEIKNRKIHT